MTVHSLASHLMHRHADGKTATLIGCVRSVEPDGEDGHWARVRLSPDEMKRGLRTGLLESRYCNDDLYNIGRLEEVMDHLPHPGQQVEILFNFLGGHAVVEKVRSAPASALRR